MPTKPNRWSQQQNYVPKGNGDASGEYADDESGSNIHFASFKKPTEAPKTEPIKPTNKKPIKNKPIENKPIENVSKQENEELNKILSKLQTDDDRKLQNIWGGKTQVCFGKGYAKEDIDEITKASEILVTDFSDLKNYVNRIGDRNNLEKYVNALKSMKEITEDDIKKEMDRIRDNVYFINDENMLRKIAIQNLTSPIKISRANNANAYWEGGKERQMIFMAKMKKDTNKDYAYNINWSSSDKKISTFYHEMGHAIDTMIDNYTKDIVSDNGYRINNIVDDLKNKIMNLREKNYNKDYDNAFDEEFKSIYGVYSGDLFIRQVLNEKGVTYTEAKNKARDNLAKKGIRKYNVSKYASTNIREFVAECFGAYYTNMNNPICDEVVNAYKKCYNEIQNIVKGEK